MEQYTIFCTPEQTRKALELGAPIEELEYNCQQGWIYEKVTAEQMIGWLEEQGIAIILESIMDGDGIGYCWIAHTFNYNEDMCMKDDKMLSRKEATLAAIDAALEYLIKLKD